MVKQFAKRLRDRLNPLYKSPPNFLITGVQRSATLSLYQYLKAHPQICLTHSNRETYFFNVPENYQRGYGWYLNHFPSQAHKGDRLTFECSPSYLWPPEVPARIHQTLGSIKQIVLLRNPTDRAYSAWQMYQSYDRLAHLKDRADHRSFAQAMAEELGETPLTTDYPYGYLSRGHYARQLTRFYEYFDPKTILILAFDDFCQNLAQTLKIVTDFLTIAPFSPAQVQKFRSAIYGQATYVQQPEDKDVLEKLDGYFAAFNQDLSELENRQWFDSERRTE